MTSSIANRYNTMRNSTYSTTYGSTYRNTPSSGYGKTVPSYQAGYLSKPSPARVHSTSKRADVHVPSNTVKSRLSQYESNNRPLPPGPGPLDARNRKISFSDASSLRQARALKRDTDPPSPVKADHSVGSYSTSRAAMTNGHSHNSSSYYQEYSPVKSHALHRRKEHSSNSSLSNDSQQSTAEDIQALKLTDSKHTMASSTASSHELPDIHRTRERVDEAGDDRRMSRMRNTSNDLNYLESKIERRSSFLNDSSNNNRGLLGLSNLGNTCYMNSMIQCVSNTRPLLEYLCQHEWERDTNPSSRMRGSLIKAFAKLVKGIWDSTSSTYISPNNFRSELNRFTRRFSGFGQQDAQEFLIYLIEGLHEDVNRVQVKKAKSMLSDEHDKLPPADKAAVTWQWYLNYDNSFMVDVFVGQLKSSLTCAKCGYISNTFDPFWEIPLPLKKRGLRSQKLTDCFDDFVREDILDGDERPTCANCKTRQKCSKAFSIWKFPRILILHLKRFDPLAAFPTKLTTDVDFPLNNLDLSAYASQEAPGGRGSCLYDLYAVSNHMGTARGGHYTAYARHPYSGEWHHFNDTRCSSVSKKTVVSSEAYVLFYERRGSYSGSHL